MKNKHNIVTLCILFLGVISLYAQDLEAIKSEIKEAELKEQNAFKNGNCAKVMKAMEDDITFLANGRRVPSKDMIGKFCKSIPRPFKKPDINKLEAFALSETSGYTIKTLEYPNDENTKIEEFVTKIWRKSNGTWKISHLHSTVKEIPKVKNKSANN